MASGNGRNHPGNAAGMVVGANRKKLNIGGFTMKSNRMTYPELRGLFTEYNKEHLGEPMTAYIVFAESNWPDRHYPELSRTYEIRSDSKAFRPSCCSASLVGFCADGTDQNVRLDWYMADCGNKGGWVVDYCYLKDANETTAE